MPMFANCKGPTWKLDDFSDCFQRTFLQTVFPLIIVGTSAIYLIVQIAHTIYNRTRKAEYVKLRQSGRPWATGPHYQSPHLDGFSGSDTADEDSDCDEHLTLQGTLASECISEVNKPNGRILVVLVEELTVLAELGLHVATYLTRTRGRDGEIPAIAGIAVWSYIAVIASLRLLSSSTVAYSYPRLWYHTAFCYGFLWVLSILSFRSALLHPRSALAQKFAIADFSLLTALFITAITSRKGNKTVEVEYEGDLEPSKEQTASVFSLATFSWVDPIVWKGYWKTYELTDVWNLLPRDKAASVLANYRQVRKTNSLALHLLRHFKRSLIIQGLWAVLSGFLTFVPTLLLKAILEYVQAPTLVPRNAAWLFVILLFVSGCAAALAENQALWIGRRVCIRLRAVVIGEIYAKALKRRAASGADKVLGNEVDNSQPEQAKPSLVKRVLTMGKHKDRTKKAENTSKPAESADGQVTSGAIINLMAVDSFKVSEICAYLHFLWAATPVQVVMAIYLLYKILGFSSIAGIGMMILLLPVNMTIAKQFARIQKLILAGTDARINTTNEVLGNIRIIKFFAWEQRFMSLVDEKRAIELGHLKHRYTWWAIGATVWSGAPVLITLLSFFVYTQIEKKALVPSVAFTALSLFQILRIPLDQLADMIAHVQEAKVSVDRVEEYLNEPETGKYEQLRDAKLDDQGNPVIGFEGATFSWSANEDLLDDEAATFRLMNLNFRFKVDELNVIVGPTGCGKTSLLMALLGEMTKLEGQVFLPGFRSREDLVPNTETHLTNAVAYCAQQAWLVNDTIKENIVFASPWNSSRYQDVLNACSLSRDLEILDNGDQTLVGEKGVTLSGGQKQRISLARALYSSARHVILDDVLSAVDSHTAKWIFEEGLMGSLMHNRTCILVTHNAALTLPHASFALVMDNGKVAAHGTPEQVVASGKLADGLAISRPASRVASRLPSRVPSVSADGPLNAVKQPNGNVNGHVKQPSEATKQNHSEKSGNSEVKAEGSVKLGIILLYLRSMGPWWYWIVAALVFACQQGASVGTNVWIRQWANAYGRKQISLNDVRSTTPLTHLNGITSTGTCLRSGTCAWQVPFFATTTESRSAEGVETHVNDAYYLGVYAILGLCFAVITFSREFILFAGSIYASRKIHTRLIESVCRAKFRFFDSTPLGQIMNRFSKDIEAVDQEIAPVAVGVIHCMASILTIVVLISVITPGFLIAGFFISILYFLIGKFYLRSSVNLKRLESVQRSPLYQQFGETLSGMTTIRAYSDERRFLRENLNKINTHSRPFLYLWAANRWLAFRVDIVGAMVSFFAGTFVILSAGRIDAGAAGLALTYAVTFTENVLWFVRLYSSNEQNMNSIERIKEYLDVEQEAEPIVPTNRPPGNWPAHGGVEFIGYSTRYRKDFDLVLRQLTFKIEPGQKVGVVGRTGAGKSSLAMALFRALEAEEGKILVDDVDIGMIGLQDLRENIVMVPQDPTLFTGTIRSNLDPFNLFTDDEIFTALKRVQLISSNSATPVTPRSATPRRSPSPSSPKRQDSAQLSQVSTPALGSPNPPSKTDRIRIDIPDPELWTPSMGSPTENKNIFLTLSSPITESGSNLSQGQRQLLCLARALLKTPKVLLMDEATASIDYATDAKIQETIREIKNTTITIAHRLQTIIDYDAVLVLDQGKVIEYGSPWELLQKGRRPDVEDGAPSNDGDGKAVVGIFRGMCEMSGDLEVLEKEAKQAWMKKQGRDESRGSSKD